MGTNEPRPELTIGVATMINFVVVAPSMAPVPSGVDATAVVVVANSSVATALGVASAPPEFVDVVVADPGLVVATAAVGVASTPLKKNRCCCIEACYNCYEDCF